MTLRALAAATVIAACGMPVPGSLAAELRLMMFEQPGCIYCARWHEEIGPEYPLTAEGMAAPLQRQDLHAPLPDGITITVPPVFTPTFVLLKDGAESGRIEGYPGEDFFWPMLAGLIAETAPQDAKN